MSASFETDADDVRIELDGRPSGASPAGVSVSFGGAAVGGGEAGGGPRAVLRRYRRWAVGLDLAIAAAAMTLAVGLRFADVTAGPYLFAPLLAPVVWVGAVAAYRAYEPRFLGAGPEEINRILHAGLLVFAGIAVASYTAAGQVSRSIVLFAVPATVAASLTARWALRAWLHRMRSRGQGVLRALVVGSAEGVTGLVEQLRRHPSHGYDAVGICVPAADARPSHISGVPVVGQPHRAIDAVDACRADVVAVAAGPGLSGQLLRRLSWDLEDRGVELLVSPGIVEVAGPRLSIRPISELSLLHLEQPATSGGWLTVKAVVDRVLGTLLLTLAAPLMVAIAIAVRVTSPGPVLFRQTRMGANDRTFTIYKFRSMVDGAHALKDRMAELDEGNGVLFKVRTDPRVTPVGRFLRRLSLDELPQLVNVVRGDMSLVGPRPPLPEEVAVYTPDAARRLRVRPGLTGLWQVSGRSDLSWEESLRLDLRYVDNWSLTLDLVILWRTLRAVVFGKGAY